MRNTVILLCDIAWKKVLFHFYYRIPERYFISRDIRRYLAENPGDVLYGDETWWSGLEGIEADTLYRSAIQQGLTYHQEKSRGLLPAGLVEEIHAVSRPPIRWDVELAKWFDRQFEPLEKRRSYARLSRRQNATPDIPRPAWHVEELAEQRIFGVLLDTSGSMDRALLAAALGSIASYSQARDVHHVRVVFCDAAAYDQGVMSPEEIDGAVKVRGRGGTRLQPGLDLLEQDERFPKDAPVLIIALPYFGCGQLPCCSGRRGENAGQAETVSTGPRGKSAAVWRCDWRASGRWALRSLWHL